ncbi:MAG: trehalose-phosphatase [Methanobacterium sp.]|nr:trehalose-phosphatase [Methanobacterium sp.]
MNPIYVFDELEELAKYKKDHKTSILIDIDGTISEISPTPEKAVVTSSMRKQLIKLKKKYQMVAVISGRSVKDAMTMVGVDGLLYIGNHGMEYFNNGKITIDSEAQKYLDPIKNISKKLKNSELSQIKGLIFEDKGICFSIHYRECESQKNAHQKILEIINKYIDKNKLKIMEGRKIVEIKPLLSKDKGFIVEKIIKDNHLHSVMYLGDDITDFDAFTKLQELEKNNIQTASILVLSNEIPDYVKNSSLFYVKNVDDVLKFFKWLTN